MLRWVGYKEHLSPECLFDFDSDLGKGGYTIFTDIVYNRFGVRFVGAIPWCVIFVWAAHPNIGILGKPCSGTITMIYKALLRGRWRGKKYTPSPNDIVLLRNTRSEVAGHIGIVLEECNNRVITIEGNAVDFSGTFDKDVGGSVSVRMRKSDDWHIVGYIRMDNK